MPNSIRTQLCVRLPLSLALLLAALVPAGAQVFDSDNVYLLSRQDHYPGYNDVWGFVGTDGREYVIQGTTTGTSWWDVDDPTNPVEVTFIPGPGSTWRDMYDIGNYVYVGTEGGGGIQIVDISTPSAPFLAATYTGSGSGAVGQSHNVFGDRARELLYVVGGYSGTTNGGLQIFDVSSPLAPVWLSSWDNQYVHDISTEGTLGFASLINQSRFRPLDLSNPSSPSNYGVWIGDPASHASWPLGDGIHYAAVQESFGGHLKIFDYTLPNSPTLVFSDNPEPQASAHNVHVEGDKLYVSWYARGTRIYDATNPTALTEIGWYDTYPPTDGGGVGPGNWGVFPHLPSGIIASNGDNGLFLLQYDPLAAAMDGTISSDVDGVLANATATKTSPLEVNVTDVSGAYRFTGQAGNYTIVTTAFGHAPDTTNVLAIADATVTTNITLTKYATGALEGTLTDAVTTNPVGSVSIQLVGTPLTATTNASGFFSFSAVPTQPSATYDLNLLVPGYAPKTIQAAVVAGNTIVADATLDPAEHYVDFSSTAGWTTQNLGASTGLWEFGEPVGTSFQPNFDNTPDPEDQAAVTGNTGGGAGDDDVDDGTVLLFSPVYDLSAMVEPHAYYYRWYGVNSNADAWQVHVTTDAGSNWALIESSVDHAPFWQAFDLDLTSVAGGASAVQFRFTAEDPPPGQIVEAALDDFAIYDAGGGGAVGVGGLPDRPTALSLAQNYPNPFPQTTRIEFSLPAKGHVQLSVFDVTGRRVATLVDSPLPQGSHSADWAGRTFDGQKAAAGVYFYKLKTENTILTKKMIRIQ